MRTYIWFKTDMTMEWVEREEDLSLEELQLMVGGYIEMVSHPGCNFTITCNEEGRLKGLPPNPWMKSFVGNLVLGVIEGEGEFKGFDFVQLQKIKTKWGLS